MPAAAAARQDIDRVASALAACLPTLHRTLDRRILGDFPHDRLPEAQITLLRLVADQEGVTVREAARSLLMQANNVSALVSQLTREGLLERRGDAADKRVAHLHTTAVARERIAEAEGIARRHLSAALRHLTGGELDALGSALGALNALDTHLRPTED
ncbi:MULTISPECIES: MarR family winged helix-turn-helix transcriptional regulator [unclassified Streptomyces]|uniref:MarR family winged helix-turn-helix transcriptional regulator n=1 Tax=unclassified Streptomyces TaxID=2593676 RepID=UPI000DB9E157|nr:MULTISPECIES: MarR family winged helix-turn-helix transcriptional regulator [unclassified Streptomyces]MYT74853.1 MarR family transcriptional regulator [Streptomyces sp. SID8367]RAJ91840.1 DNA-binding MarR family transcriptional regulator [Streptomyces sp. PsTaAH-137]